MFDSPPNTCRFRIDPWASDYGSAILDLHSDEAGAPDPRVDASVETSDWSRPLISSPRPWPGPVIFVDGVQRVDVWGQVEEADRSADAALASVAVGAAFC